MTNEEVRTTIINMTIPEFGQPTTPEKAIEKRGYDLARGLYAEEKLKILNSIEKV